MKYTSSSSKVKNYPSVDKPEHVPDVMTDIVEGAKKVDPSVRLGALRGEPNGSVPMEVTMRKPEAYKAKAGPK